MMTILLTLRWKLFHHNQVEPIGTMTATVASGQIRLGKPKLNELVEKMPDGILTQLKPVVRGHVREYLKDMRYCILWNEDTGLETTCKML
jgi:hypothetical protein